MIDNKDVAVVMCTYNGERYLKQQLDSILAQSYPIKEIYIQDDCSTDGTASILKSYAQQYPNIKYHINDKQLGINENFFSAFSKIASEYIAISDQDDIWFPDKIEKEILAISDNLLCFCRSMPFSEDASFVHVDKRTPNWGLERLVFVNVIPGHTILFKKELLQILPKGFNSLGLYDNLLSFTAALCGKLTFCNQFLCHYRRHADAITLTVSHDYTKSIKNVTRMFFSSVRIFCISRKTVERHYQQLYAFMNACSMPEKANMYVEVQKFVEIMQYSSLLSFLKRSLWCYKHRQEIFYTKTNDSILLKIRALLFPILMYQYWDYTS